MVKLSMSEKTMKSAKLTKAVSFRLDDDSYSVFMKKVQESGLSPSDFFRDCVITNRTLVLERFNNKEFIGEMLYSVNKAETELEALLRTVSRIFDGDGMTDNQYDQIIAGLKNINEKLVSAVLYVD